MAENSVEVPACIEKTNVEGIVEVVVGSTELASLEPPQELQAVQNGSGSVTTLVPESVISPVPEDEPQIQDGNEASKGIVAVPDDILAVVEKPSDAPAIEGGSAGKGVVVPPPNWQNEGWNGSGNPSIEAGMGNLAFPQSLGVGFPQPQVIMPTVAVRAAAWKGSPNPNSAPCRNYAAGYCSFGNRCSFAHGLTPGVPMQQEVQLCRNFANGNCTYGEYCGYSHDSEKLLQSLASTPAVSSLPCKNFKKGNCKYGAWCGYLHQVVENPFDLPMSAAPSLTGTTVRPNTSGVIGPMWLPEVEEALNETLQPVANVGQLFDLQEMIRQCMQSISTIAAKYFKDHRRASTGSTLQAEAICAEFVRAVMKSLAEVCADKPWFSSGIFSRAIEITARNIFRGSKAFCRTPAIAMQRYVDEALLRFGEDSRIENAFNGAVAAVSNVVQPPFDQLLLGHLQGAYDEAHLIALWGQHGSVSTAEGLLSPELGFAQDFVKGWIVEFVRRAQLDVLQSCVGQGIDERIKFVTLLFEFLTGPENCVIPYDLRVTLTTPIPASWPFVRQVVTATLSSQSTALQPGAEAQPAIVQTARRLLRVAASTPSSKHMVSKQKVESAVVVESTPAPSKPVRKMTAAEAEAAYLRSLDASLQPAP